MLLSGLIRHYVTILLQTPPKPQSLLVIREQRALLRGQLLKTNANYLPPNSFLELKAELQSNYTSGYYLKSPLPLEGEVSAPPPNPLTDPGAMDGMMNMVKGQAVSFLPQTILMYYIGYFYDGFVLSKCLLTFYLSFS